jgi:hypothetical protein
MRHRIVTLTALTAVLGLLLVGTALADIVDNDILEADANTVELEVGDTRDVTITIEVESTSDGDGAGCNIGGAGNQLVLDVASSTPTKVSVTPAQLTFVDCDDERTVTVTALQPTDGVGAVIGFTVNGETQLRSGDRRTVNQADFVVNVFAPAADDEPVRDAPAIANEHLRNRADNSDCQDANGTNKNKNNWHGQLISKVAKHFDGQSFTAAQEGTVTSYVEGLCSG